MTNNPALASAVEWYISLNDPAVTAAEQAAFEQWLAQSAQHRQAWQTVLEMHQPFNGLDAKLTQQVFFQKDALRSARRASMKKIASVLIIGAGSGVLYQQQPWRGMLADFSTNKGERREITLPDNTVLVLNSDTAVNIHMTGGQRSIELIRGQVMVTTGHPQQALKHLQVSTHMGVFTAMGTRFSIHAMPESITLDVFSHAVRVLSPHTGNQALLVQAGQRLRLQQDTRPAIQPLPIGSDLWVNGILSVVDMPLHAFLSEIERYHHGFFRCDASIAMLPVSGAFPIAQRDQILVSLQQTYHLQTVQYMRVWTQLKPAP